jgi:dTDP-4-dehydrorhamnose 3,5-epimerase
MNIIPTSLPGILLIEPKVFSDHRGFFFESWNARAYEAAGISGTFVQDNHSYSLRNALRGLHYQIRQPQGKLIRVLSGEIYDVAVDIRRSSPHFGKWVGMRLSAENKRMAWMPPGFAHGFLVLSDEASVAYKNTDYYAPEQERSIIWNDPAIGIDWPLNGEPLLSPKDAQARRLGEAEVFD